MIYSSSNLDDNVFELVVAIVAIAIFTILMVLLIDNSSQRFIILILMPLVIIIAMINIFTATRFKLFNILYVTLLYFVLVCGALYIVLTETQSTMTLIFIIYLSFALFAMCYELYIYDNYRS